MQAGPAQASEGVQHIILLTSARFNPKKKKKKIDQTPEALNPRCLSFSHAQLLFRSPDHLHLDTEDRAARCSRTLSHRRLAWNPTLSACHPPTAQPCRRSALSRLEFLEHPSP